MRFKSILKEFYFFSFTIIAISLITSCFLIVSFFNQRAEYIQESLATQAGRAERTVIDCFDYTAHLMKYMGDQIAEHGEGTDLLYIKDLLKSFRMDMKINNLTSWSTFLWANTKDQIIVEGVEGVLDSPRNISKRDYAPAMHTEPGKIHIGQPVYGVVSRQWTLPAGVGIVNSKKQYIGSVVTGFNIRALTHRLETALNVEGVSLALYDLDLVMIDSTSYYDAEKDSSFVTRHLRHTAFTDPNAPRTLEVTSSLGLNYPLYYFHKLPKYPFVLVLKYDQHLFEQMLWGEIKYKATVIFLCAAVLLALLFILRKRIVKPVVQLSDAAYKMSCGDSNVQLPEKGAVEIMILSSQANSLNLEKKAKEESQKAMDMAKLSELEKREFIRKLNHELNTSLNYLLASTELLLKEYPNDSGMTVNLTKAKKQEILTGMLQSAWNIKYRINTITTPAPVVISNFLQSCIITTNNRALAMRVQVLMHTPDPIPDFLTEELRLRQIIVALINRSIDFHCVGGKIDITAKLSEEEGKQYLYLEIEDDAPGFPETERKRLEHKYDNGVSMRSDGTDLEFEAIEILVQLLKGSLTIVSEYGQIGNKATLKLPYLTKEQLVDSSASNGADNSSNVIKFDTAKSNILMNLSRNEENKDG